MEQTRSRPKGRHGQGSVYFDHLGSDCRDTERHRKCSGQWAGAISLGPDPKRPGKYLRAKVYGRSRAEVLGKLDAKREDARNGLKVSASYTVRHAVDDWLAHGLDRKDAKTKELYQGLLGTLMGFIGTRKLRDLTTLDIRLGMEQLTDRWSDRTFEIARNALDRAIKYAMANDRVGRNVAALVEPPGGKEGRPSKSMTLEQAKALMEAAKGTRLEAYIVLSLTTGIRTEEARALTWEHVDLEGSPVAGIPPHMDVWKSVRHGGDTKTDKSRRTLELPQKAAEALREHRRRQREDRLKAGALWQDSGLVFTSVLGEPLAAYRVNRDFQVIAKRAGLGEGWTPRMMRHTFVSVMSAEDVPLEEIARQVGHSRTSTTETVYRKQLKPVITRGAQAANRAFG